MQPSNLEELEQYYRKHDRILNLSLRTLLKMKGELPDKYAKDILSFINYYHKDQAYEAYSKRVRELLELQAEFEREKILILANASAAEKIIAAKGEASSRLIIANGTAESIRIIAEDAGMNATELTNLYLTLEALKEIAKTTQNFVVILGQDGLTYLIPVGQEEP